VPSHNKEDQFSILLFILQDYGIKKKLKAIIANNAPSNNVLYRTIEKYIKEKYNKK
jgi:hypothetical protein